MFDEEDKSLPIPPTDLCHTEDDNVVANTKSVYDYSDDDVFITVDDVCICHHLTIIVLIYHLYLGLRNDCRKRKNVNRF